MFSVHRLVRHVGDAEVDYMSRPDDISHVYLSIIENEPCAQEVGRTFSMELCQLGAEIAGEAETVRGESIASHSIEPVHGALIARGIPPGGDLDR